jgi:hypothetical protein
MGLNETQKADVRLFLGWQARFHSIDSSLELAMRALDEASNADALDQIVRAIDDTKGPGILAMIKAIDAKIHDDDIMAGVEAAGSIHLKAPEGLGVMRSKGRMWCARMASLLGVRVRSDYFGTTANGPVHGLANFEGTGGGNLPPLG